MEDRRARALQICSRPHFSEMHKNWSKKFIFHQVGFCPWIPSLLQRSTFLPSFYAFPKNVVLNNFVELELFYKTHFSDFELKNFFHLLWRFSIFVSITNQRPYGHDFRVILNFSENLELIIIIYWSYIRFSKCISEIFL